MAMIKKTGLFLLLGALFCGSAAAQIQIDKSRPARPRGEVGIENLFGSVEVIGWDQEKVSVTGSLAAGTEIDLRGEEGEVWIDLDVPESWLYESDDDTEYRSGLIVHVPFGSSVSVETINAIVTVRDVSGSIEVETVNGNVAITGDFPAVEVESMTGSIEIRAGSAEMDVETLSGSVVLHGARGRVSVGTVSGPIALQGNDFQEVRIETTSGSVTFDGGFRTPGEMEIESHDGDVEIILPRSIKAEFECITFGGQITSDYPGRPRRETRFDPHTELRFSTSLESELDISIETFSGDITLRARPE